MAHNRLVVDGSLLGGAERWSCSVGFGSVNGDVVAGPVPLSAWAEAVLASFKATNSWNASMKACLGSNGTIDRVRTYQYATVGTPAIAAGVSSGGPAAGTNSVVMPPQCSIVVSLITGFAGAGYRGRFYWPRLTGALDAGGKISGNPAPALVSAAAAAMLSEMATNSGVASLEPAVISGGGGGRVTPVTQVSVGDVVDTQRRRRDGLVEVRVTTNIP